MESAKVKPLKKGAIVTIFLLAIVLVFAACSSPTDTAPEELFKVSFAANGGYPEPEALLVPKGGLTIGTPSAIAYSNNHNGRNALTPIYSEEAPYSAASPYTERTATFTVAVSGFSSDSDANNVGLVISAVPGLSFSGHDAVGNASSGTKTFTVTITLLDTVTFGTGTASISITGLSTGGISGAPGGYVCTDTRSTAASIIDGRDMSRAIPLYQANINEFNTYANTTEGQTGHYKLMEDVTLPPVAAGESNWEAIGKDSGYFTGSFDGQSHTISNLTINAPGSDFQGIFGSIAGDGLTSGIVKNVGLVGGSINGNTDVGGVVGHNNQGTVENCYSTGDISGRAGVGGVVGYNYQGTVGNCYSTGDISGRVDVGGVVGVNMSTVENCVALNPVVTRTSGTNQDFGRVVGFNDSGATLSGNHARENMKFIDGPTSTLFTPSPPVTSDLNGVHGLDVMVGTSVAPAWR